MTRRQRQIEADLRAVRWLLEHGWEFEYASDSKTWTVYDPHHSYTTGIGPTAAAALRAARKQVREQA